MHACSDAVVVSRRPSADLEPISGDGDAQGSTTVGQLRIGSDETVTEAREDLGIDLAAGLPYLSTCAVAADALVRYRRVFDANDADADGLLNINQLHVSLTALTNHAIRCGAVHYV